MRSNQPSVRTASRRNVWVGMDFTKVSRGTAARPVPADRKHAAPFAAGGIAAGRAALQHAHMAEREIVLGRVLGIEVAQSLGDFFGRFPGQSLPFGKAEVQ